MVADRNKTESQSSKQNHKPQNINRNTKLKTESQNSKQKHKTQNRITKPKTETQNSKQIHQLLLIVSHYYKTVSNGT